MFPRLCVCTCKPVSVCVLGVCECVCACPLLEGVIASRQSSSSRKTGLQQQQIRASSNFPPIKTTPVYLHLNNTRPLSHPSLILLFSPSSDSCCLVSSSTTSPSFLSSISPFQSTQRQRMWTVESVNGSCLVANMLPC